jgi:superfamily II DNA or RNA helicase
VFDYEVVEDSYGKKLAVDFDYDESIVEQIKTLPWEDTHRRWDDELELWTIDYDAHAIELFERTMDCMVPPEVRPDDSGSRGIVEFIVPEGYTWFFIQNPRSEIDRLLYQELAYEDPGAEYTDAYQRGTWDGIERLYNRDNHGAPRGLLDRAVALVEGLGYDTDVDVEGDRTGAAADFGWDFPHELRPYQRDAVTAVLADRGGIISLPTGTGKTVTCMKALQQEGQKSLVLVHTQELLYQWADEIRTSLDTEPGMVGDGSWSEGSEVTVAIVQTLMSRGASGLDDDYGVLVFDECHRTSAAEQMHQIGMDLDVDVRIGLSATPWRSTEGEELMIEGAIGGVSYEVSAEQMIDDGFLAKPEFEFLHHTEEQASRGEEYHDAYRRVVELNPTRNRKIAARARNLAENGYKVLINVNRIKQGKLLEFALNGSITKTELLQESEGSLDAEELREFAAAIDNLGHVADCDAVFLSGRDDTETRQSTLDRFESGDLDVLVATIMKEGVDVPAINALIEASAGKSDIQQIQVIGRALRPSNGMQAKIVDVEDHGRYFRDQYKQRVSNLADYYGAYGPLDRSSGIDVDETGELNNRSDSSERVDLTEPLTDDEMDEMEEWLDGG